MKLKLISPSGRHYEADVFDIEQKECTVQYRDEKWKITTKFKMKSSIAKRFMTMDKPYRY
jgi:hypothetical protein